MPRRIIHICVLSSILLAAHAMVSAASVPASHPAATTRPAFTAIEEKSLPNAHRVTDKVICGGLPDGERGFVALENLGVKTVISVDGITPQVALAHAHGMRYVHLPFGYDGVPLSQGHAIAKAIAEMPGPIYVHCHHGQHRAPAAAAVACIENGTLDPSQVDEMLRTFGTGLNYIGLWKSAETARPVDVAVLTSLNVNFVEESPIPAMAKAMVRVYDELDALKARQKSKWTGDGAREALQLEELLTEIGRSPAAAAKPEEFHRRLETSVSRIRQLKALLEVKPIDLSAADEALKKVGGSCTACHTSYRDVRGG